jgi:hypothetical protein
MAVALVSAVVVWSQCVAVGGHAVSPVDVSTLTRRIPQRSPRARTGSRFADALTGLDAGARERAILREILDGNVPSFLKQLAPVELRYRAAGRPASATIFVTPDYLAIGSDEDFLRIPMNLATAMTIADEFGFVLPTRKIVNAIYAQSGHHFVPEPLPAGLRMTSTDYYRTHNALIEKQARAAAVSLGTLVSGHKKDVVLTNLLTRTPGRIAIYGWHRPSGEPIQPLSTVHGACYADYSHGVRLVADTAWESGQLRSVRDILRDASLASALSDEGVIRVAASSSSCSFGVRAAD